MSKLLRQFESIVRNAHQLTEIDKENEYQHPFEIRNIHPLLPNDVRDLFDNGHYSQATFEAFKFLDKEVQRLSGLTETGKSLMMLAFRETNPIIVLADSTSESGKNIQEGYKFLFAGSVMAIRNPRGHEHSLKDDIDTCLDHLSLVSHLLRQIEAAGCTLRL